MAKRKTRKIDWVKIAIEIGKEDAVDELARACILHLLEKHSGAAAARLMGISYPYFWQLLYKFDIKPKIRNVTRDTDLKRFAKELNARPPLEELNTPHD